MTGCAAASPRGLCALACIAFALSSPAASRAEDTVRDILLARGTAAYDAGRYGEAARCFREALARSPGDAGARRSLALALSGEGRFGESARVLREICRENPDDFDSGAELCLSLALAGNADEAAGVLRGLEAKAAGDPRRAETLFLRGVIAGERGDYPVALSVLEEAAASPTAGPRARYYRGVYLARSGDRAAARRELTMLRERAPTSVIEKMAGEDADALAAPPEKRGWGGRVTTRYEYDDNVILAPDNEQLIGVSGSGDWRFMTTFELDAVPMTWGRFELDTRYSFVQSVHNRLGDFNLHGHVGEAFVRYNAPRLTPFAGFQYAYYFLDDCRQSYLRANRLFGGVDIPASSHSFYRLMYECAFDDYMLPYGPAADNWDTMPANILSLEQYLFLGPQRKAFWRTGLRYDNNNARGANYYYNGGGFTGELYVPLPERFSLDLQADYLLYGYSRNADDRRDQRFDMGADLRRNLCGEIDLVFSYDFIRNMSNVSLYQFSRNVYTLMLEMRF